MKNIHVLPTDKPSKLLIIGDRLTLIHSEYFSNQYIKLHGYKPKSLYITSDEEIKEGWVWHLGRGHLLKIGHFTEINGSRGFRDAEFNINGIEVLVRNCRKIILTTDQDLIKDGVQAINDEFLEWFVKNSSCEEVKVLRYQDVYGRDIDKYKIIIPKEESKREFVTNTSKWNIEDFEESKQELEETVEEYFLSCIKNVLQFGNDAQAIRFMEKYYEAKKQQDEK